MSHEPNSVLLRRLRRGDGIVAQEAEGLVILLHLDSGRYYSLNESGGRIWNLCDGQRAGIEIARHLALRYGVDTNTVAADVAEILTQLVNEKFLCEG